MNADGTASGAPGASLRNASWLLAGLGLIAVLHLHLLPALLAGLLVHELVHLIAPRLPQRFSNHRGKLLALGVLSAFVGACIAGLVFGALVFFRSDAGSLASLLDRMAQIIDGLRGSLPAWVIDRLPDDVAAMKSAISGWLREHAAELGRVGKETGVAAAHLLIGLVIGGMVALHDLEAGGGRGPLACALLERAGRLAEAFRRVVFAQVRISALNALLTGIYLAMVLPLFGVQLPLTKTLIGVTFIAGLLPVIGNLVSNTVIVVVSLAHSPQAAIASLAFLVIVHKLEYFLNARIVGTQISATAWELLLAMLLMEAAFGLPGVVAAPIYYAYIKSELRAAGLV